jgi:uncharacterized protein (DUF433 family)/antitoxin component of MazEF toxin-antitoxin module
LIEKTPNVCGGDARIADTRIPIWLLVLKRQRGQSDAAVLHSYPTLTQATLDAAWEYYREHPVEIEQAIWLSNTAANVPEGAPVPAAVIVAGRLLGLDDATIREAFEPALAPEAIAAAWSEYRADPAGVGRHLAAHRIPKSFAEEAGFHANAPVELSLVAGALVVKPVVPPPLTLEELLRGVTDDNLPGEWGTGPATGKEVW